MGREVSTPELGGRGPFSRLAWCVGWVSVALGGVDAAAPRRLLADEIVALTTDFSTGSVTTVGTSAPWSTQIDVASICSDPVGRAFADRVYIVGRFGCDAIQVLNPFNGYQTQIEFAVGSNPQDIWVLAPNRAYVSFYESNTLLEVNPQTGATLGSISLAQFADVDGLVEMHRMYVHGRHLYVQLQRLDRSQFPYVPVAPSMLAVVDLITRTLVDVDPGLPGAQAIELTATNPIAPMAIDLTSGDLLVPCTGAFGVMNDGGIERVDLTDWESDGMWLSGPAMNGDLVDFSTWSGSRAFIIVSDASFNTSLHPINPITGVKGAAIFAPGGFTLSDCLTHHNGSLFVTDRDFFDPGVRVFSAESGAPLSGLVPTGLPPFELFVRPDFPSDVAEDLATPRATLFTTPPWPNPSSGEVRLRVAEGASVASVDVLDVVGRRVAVMEGSRGGVLRWDGRNAAGYAVAAGEYFVRAASASGQRESVRVLVVR